MELLCSLEHIFFILKKGVFMYVRLTYLNFLPGRAEEAKKIYNTELVPTVRKQKGNLDCRVLEPVDKADDYISMTTWDSKEDADAYQSSGVYRQLVDRLKSTYAKDPVLKVYSAESIMEPA
jgi:heme-degrading monooxygenase HmoA